MAAMFRLLDVPVEVEDRPGAVPLAVAGGRVEFDDVMFGYDPRRPILKGLSFAVPEGRTLAIVGPSGAGKSTVSRLLFRFYDVEAGAIRIDGRDLRDVTQDSLRAQSMMNSRSLWPTPLQRDSLRITRLVIWASVSAFRYPP
jgi:ATP-binding cassette subfamily B protein